MDPAYLDLVGKSLSAEDLENLKNAIEDYNYTCSKAAEELNNFCESLLKLPPEETVSMKQ